MELYGGGHKLETFRTINRSDFAILCFHKNNILNTNTIKRQIPFSWKCDWKFLYNIRNILKNMKLMEHVLYVYLFVKCASSNLQGLIFEYSFSNILSHYSHHVIICLSYNISIKKLDMKFVKQTWLSDTHGLVNFFSYIILTSVACAFGLSVITSSTDLSFQNLVFWTLFEFSVAEIS